MVSKKALEEALATCIHKESERQSTSSGSVIVLEFTVVYTLTSLLVLFVSLFLYRRRVMVARLVKKNFSRLESIGFTPDMQLECYPDLVVRKSFNDTGSNCENNAFIKGSSDAPDDDNNNDDAKNGVEEKKVNSANGRRKPFKRGYVFIGGFGDTPAMWADLGMAMEKEGHFCVAPRTPGWGRTNFKEVSALGWREWVLRAMESVVLAQRLCNHVTVVGHSTGAITAALVVERLAVDRAVFTGPNFVAALSDTSPRNLLLHPIIGRLAEWWLVAVPKKKRIDRPVDNMNPAVWDKGYYLTALPIHAVRQMWEAQDVLAKEWKVKDVVLLMGEEDRSVAPMSYQVEKIEPFIRSDVSFRAEIIPNAAHGLPTETPAVIQLVADVLLQ